MDSEVREVLLGVQNGSMSVDQALLHLKQKPFEDMVMPRWISTAASARGPER